MEILNTIKFVRSAVDSKTPIQDMQHLILENGHVRSTDGVLSLGSPIDVDLTCAPHADTLVRALAHCKDVVSLGLTPSGRLRVSSGKFKAFVPCVEVDGGMYHPKPSGQQIEVDGELLLTAFKRLEPFVCTDMLRPWTNGILLKGQSAFATNNVCLAEVWLGVDLPFTANIPLPAIKAMVKQGTPPSMLMMDNNSVTFLYDSGRWIKSQLYESEWPDLSKLLNRPSNPKPLPEDFFAALAAVGKFTDDGKVYFAGGCMVSSTSDQDGARYEVDGLPDAGIYRSEMLALLKGVATHADFDRYPTPAAFFGENIRGIVMGLNP